MYQRIMYISRRGNQAFYEYVVMAKVVWTKEALALADEWLIESEEKFGIKTKNKLKQAFVDITKRLSIMPKTGPLDDVFMDEDGEFRFLHANKALKVCYRVIDDDNVIVFAVLHVRMNTNTQKAYL